MRDDPPNKLSQLIAQALEFHGRGQFDQSIAALRAAIELNPSIAEIHFNLANALVQIGQLDEAIAAYRLAIKLRPEFADAYTNLAGALAEQGDLIQAVAAFRSVAQLKPNDPEAHFNLGIALADQGELTQAISAYQRAIELNRNDAEIQNNLGNAYMEQSELAQAVAAYRIAIELKNDYADAHSNLGNALAQQGQLDQAIAVCRAALLINPNLPQAHSNLGNILRDQGETDQAIAALRTAISLQPDYARAHSNLLYTTHFHPEFDARAIAREHDEWNSRHAEPLKSFIHPHANDRNPNRRLRIGYVSPDLRDHPVGRFLLPVLAHHDKRYVEVFAYAQVVVSDDITRQIHSHVDQWRSIVGLSDVQAADLIRHDQIDILIDLSLHMSKNRLLFFARKPAPVQATWLGYPGSTGMTAIDYRLSDPHLDPPGSDESIYSEQTIRLAHSFWCYDPLRGRDCAVSELPALTNKFITFGCLNNFSKVNDAVLRVWSRILTAVPASRLLLMAPQSSARQRTLNLLEQESIDSNRVEFVGNRLSHMQYLEQYRRIDLALDPFPYNGHTTTCDSLWMGVPVVTLAGSTVVGRGGVSILSNVGLPELVAHSRSQYVKIAVSVASDLSRLGKLRSTIRQMMSKSPLMDAPAFARDIDQTYGAMWRQWCGK